MCAPSPPTLEGDPDGDGDVDTQHGDDCNASEHKSNPGGGDDNDDNDNVLRDTHSDTQGTRVLEAAQADRRPQCEDIVIMMPISPPWRRDEGDPCGSLCHEQEKRWLSPGEETCFVLAFHGRYRKRRE